MRKFFLFLAALIAALGCLICIHKWIYEKRDDLNIYPIYETGDASVLDGMTCSTRFFLEKAKDKHIFWETKHTFGAGTKSELVQSKEAPKDSYHTLGKYHNHDGYYGDGYYKFEETREYTLLFNHKRMRLEGPQEEVLMEIPHFSEFGVYSSRFCIEKGDFYYDGEYLYLIERIEWSSNPAEFWVLVQNQDGVVYYGEYQTSLAYTDNFFSGYMHEFRVCWEIPGSEY